MTSNSDDDRSDRSEAEKEASILALIWSMADTTWRMFTPPALLVGGGLWVDVKYHTKPWLTIAGAVIGLGMSVLLVRQQLSNK